jgi:CRP/FNR family transcriptional regulator
MTLVEDSQILSIDYKAFKKYFLNNGLLCLQLANEMIHQSKLLQDLVSREFVFNSVAKVAMMLSSDLDMFNRLKRYDISLMLHIQPATLSRVLKRLKRDSIIDILQGKVIIVDAKRLKNIYKEPEDE